MRKAPRPSGRHACVPLLLPFALLGCFEPDSRVTEEPETKVVEAPEPTIDPRRFIGRWAEAPDQCVSDWWRFWGDELRTKTAGQHCDILPPDGRFLDTEIRTKCRISGKFVRETWTIDYAEDGKAMTIRGEDKDKPAVELVKCT
ncbi:hypothetical protein KCG44_01260 [Pacificimonas sp. WHA3]|uniref:Alkaline proteinase inhibitor/ Outer membrane lipoprotein Omp19 domain-containing protein n=1 Tax=Pacificimonas pallii TaxID=2827236 RepID=A0ABS6SB19_9SPHN|nr:hypothetical protein [Pacificimonas pallii]MBV7255405.1 hypothetical protein [Pacificimonas pallii]